MIYRWRLRNKNEKNREEIDKQLKKLDRENKKKETKLKEFGDIKERLRLNEQKLEELLDSNNKSFADWGVQATSGNSSTTETQTDMTLNGLESLEKNLEKVKREKNKYMKAIKSITSKRRKTSEYVFHNFA